MHIAFVVCMELCKLWLFFQEPYDVFWWILWFYSSRFQLFIFFTFFLTHLPWSSLQGNNITGDIPKEFGNLTSLVRLDLENNKLTGEIPYSLGSLRKLQFL